MFDLVVIGSGPGGYVSAIKGAQLGGKVALVEGGDIGGCCLNRGCMPTKALIHSAHTLLSARSASLYGVDVPEVRFNLEGAMAHKEATIKRLVDGLRSLVLGNGIKLCQGWATIPHPGAVTVTYPDGQKETLATRNIVLATGARPKAPPLSEESLSNTITSDQALVLDQVPRRMAIIGGGEIGIEFACIWNAFGSHVSVFEYSPSIIPRLDREMARRLLPLLRRQGIDIKTGIRVREVRDDGGQRVVVAESGSGALTEHKVDVVLRATGREPFFGGIDLCSLGVDHDKTGVRADEAMRTNIPGILAIGDVVGRAFLAHVASAEGIVAAETAMGVSARMDYRVVPACVFSIPECASVGYSEDKAKDHGYDVEVSKFPFAANGRAVSMGATDGFVKIVTEVGSGKILGAHVLGAHADDLIHELALAMSADLGVGEVSRMIHAHPSLSEAVLDAAHSAAGNPIHTLSRQTGA